MKKTVLYFVLCFIVLSCAVTHDKRNLINFNTNRLTEKNIKLNGYYYCEYERNIDYENPPFYYEEYIKITGIKKVKVLNSLFFYDDGFTLPLDGVDGLTTYYCAQGGKSENSYENAHQNIHLIIEAQKSNDKRIKRNCDFRPNEISGKGLTEILGNKIKIQYYQTEKQIPNKDSFNSYYLYEMNGIIKNDSTFIISEIKNYRNDSIIKVNYTYKFRQSNKKPEILNYFKKNM